MSARTSTIPDFMKAKTGSGEERAGPVPFKDQAMAGLQGSTTPVLDAVTGRNSTTAKNGTGISPPKEEKQKNGSLCL